MGHRASSRLLAVCCAVLSVLGCRSGGSATRQPADQAAIVFRVTTIQPSGNRTSRQESRWTGGVDEDTVQVLLPRSDAPWDSVRLFVHSGPERLSGDLPNVGLADSLGSWRPAPDTLLHNRRNVDAAVQAEVVPLELVSWVRTAMPSQPYLTRVSVEAWAVGSRARGELRVAEPM